MRTNPRKACANEEERLFWALVHDGIAHPLMAVTLFSAWSVWFHDWTSRRAWPRRARYGEVRGIIRTSVRDFAEMWARKHRERGIPFCLASLPQPDGHYIYEIRTFDSPMPVDL